jgi:hypothetical protein
MRLVNDVNEGNVLSGDGDALTLRVGSCAKMRETRSAE